MPCPESGLTSASLDASTGSRPMFMPWARSKKVAPDARSTSVVPGVPAIISSRLFDRLLITWVSSSRLPIPSGLFLAASSTTSSMGDFSHCSTSESTFPSRFAASPLNRTSALAMPTLSFAVASRGLKTPLGSIRLEAISLASPGISPINSLTRIFADTFLACSTHQAIRTVLPQPRGPISRIDLGPRMPRDFRGSR